MKITTALTALALIATSAAATTAISDWRDEAAGAINSTLETAQALCAKGPSLRRDPNGYSTLATESAQNAVSVARLCYQKAEAEVDLAGAKVTREQLEALVLRADAYLRQTNAYCALLTATGNELNRGKPMDSYTLNNALTIGVIEVEAAAVYLSATARLADFLETN